MRARVTFTQLSPDKFAEMGATYCESTVPTARQAPGKQGLLLLTGKTAGKGSAVSLWETEADLLASESESGYYQEQLAKYEPFFTVPPVRESYEVVLRE